MGKRILSGALGLFALFAVLTLAAAPAGTKDNARIDALLNKMNAVQKDLKTLRVDFVQTNNFRMLSKPQVLKGFLVLEKPDTALYTYTSPSRLFFLVKDGNLLVYDPAAKKVVVQDIRRHQNRIMRYLGVGQPLDELTKHFKVLWIGDDKDVAHIELVPTKFRMKRKVAALHFWVNEKTGIPAAFEVVEPEGDRIRFDFKHWESNPKLASDAFTVHIPPGVKVQRRMLDFQDTFKP